MKHLILVLATTSLFACGEKNTDTATEDTDVQDTGTEEVFVLADALAYPSGCSDFVFFDRNEDDTLVLELLGQGAAEAAHTSGEALSFEYDLSALPSDMKLTVKFGTHLSYELCNDAFDPAIETTIDDTFIPVNGTLTLMVTPTETSQGMGDYPSELRVDIQMADFCAETGDGTPHHENCFNVNSYTATAAIGWLPG